MIVTLTSCSSQCYTWSTLPSLKVGYPPCAELYPPTHISPPLTVAISYARYDPNKDYYWEFPEDKKGKNNPSTSCCEEIIYLVFHLVLVGCLPTS